MIRLESGILEIDNQRFTKEDLLSLSSSNPTSIKIYTIIGDSQNHYIPNYSEDNIYTFINLDGSINNSVSIQSDDTGYFVNLSSSVVLIETKSVLIYNYGNMKSNSFAVIPSYSYGAFDSYSTIPSYSFNTNITETASIPTYSEVL